ncbi:MAG TPA: alpha/beta fold hydrolase [Gemmatimonadaceae bacterium]|nr:alpha/beta fold hydrolase [Gemmatimonadaceae bacterium]
MSEPPLRDVWDEIDGMRVHGRASDRAVAGEPVAGRHAVFVHGLGMATDYLEPAMRLVATGLAVSGLDLPGFGRSRLRRQILSLGELADALTKWMSVRGIVAPILIGQSHGCQVVVEAVARDARLASALVLNAPTMIAEHRTVAAQLIRVARDTPREPFALVPHVVRDWARAGPARMIATLRDAVRDRIEDKLARVDVPVTIVNGARDPVSPPAWGERLARLTGTRVGGAGARYVVVAGAAHAVPFSRPAALAAEVVGMARRVAGS